MTQEIAERPIPKVELPIKYALGWVHEAIDKPFTVGDPVFWNRLESNSASITTSGTTSGGEYSQIKLKPGKVYKLTGFVSLQIGSQAVIRSRFQWFNVTKNTYVGAEGGTSDENTNWTLSGSAPALAYVEADEETIFELRANFQGGDDTVSFLYGTTFEVQHLQNMKI